MDISRPTKEAHLDPSRFDLRKLLARTYLYRAVTRYLPSPKRVANPNAPVGTPRDFASDADREVMSRLYRVRVEEIVDLMRTAGARTMLLTPVGELLRLGAGGFGASCGLDASRCGGMASGGHGW